MKRIAFLAAAVALAAPVFAQTAATVAATSGSPVVIMEGPATSRPIHGAVIAQTGPMVLCQGAACPAPAVAMAPSTTVLGGPPAVVTGTPETVVVTHYWNVPPNIGSRADFRRWQRLIP
jgi:hypothetical protein